MGIVVLYDNAIDKLDLTSNPNDIELVQGSPTSTNLPKTNLQNFSKQVLYRIAPDATTDEVELHTSFYNAGDQISRGVMLAGHNFLNTGGIRVQCAVDVGSPNNTSRTGYRDIFLKDVEVLTGSPGLSSATTYQLKLFIDQTSALTVGASETVGFEPGYYVRDTAGDYAKIFSIDSGTQMTVGPSTKADGTLAVGVLEQSSTGGSPGDTSDSCTSSAHGTITTTTVSFVNTVGTEYDTFAEIVAQLEAQSGVTASLNSTSTAIRVTSDTTSVTSNIDIKAGASNDILAALTGTGKVSYGYGPYTEVTNIVLPYSGNNTFGTFDWGSNYYGATTTSEILPDFANDIFFDFGSPIANIIALKTKFWVDTAALSVVDLGRIYMGSAFAPTYNFSKNYEFSVQDLSKSKRTESGILRSESKPTFRSAKLPFNALTSTDWKSLLDLQRVSGLRKDLAIVMFPDDADYTRRYMCTFMGKMKKIPKFKEIQYGYFSTTLEFEETL